MKPPDWAIRTNADKLAIEQGCYWDDSYGDAIIEFAHTTFQPQFTRDRFKLLDWQERTLRSWYSWRMKTGDVRFSFCSLTIPKKNGKTLLTSLISCYELLNLDEPSPLVVAVAASKDNATQIWNELRNTIQSSERLAPFLQSGEIKVRKHTRTIEVPSMNATFVCMPSDGSRLHGWSCSLVAIDEAHAHKNDSVYKALRYATVSRPKHGRVVVISTAGNSTSHYYHGIYSKSKRILSGEDTDIRHYAEVYECTGDPRDKKQWWSANPSMGTSFHEDTFAHELNASTNSTAEWLNFQQLRLNIWVSPSAECWLDTTGWQSHRRDIPDKELARYECSLGVDLSQTVDPSSVSAVWKLPDDTFFVRSWAWVCEDGVNLREASNLPKYQNWAELAVTEGNMIDANLIKSHILKLCNQYSVESINFDPNSAFVLMNDIENEGFKCLRVPQTHRYFSPVMKRFEQLYKAGKVYHNGGGWLQYCFENVRLDVNRHDEIRAVRRKSIDHIDGAIATLLGCMTSFSGIKDSITSESGVLFV